MGEDTLRRIYTKTTLIVLFRTSSHHHRGHMFTLFDSEFFGFMKRVPVGLPLVILPVRLDPDRLRFGCEVGDTEDASHYSTPTLPDSFRICVNFTRGP